MEFFVLGPVEVASEGTRTPVGGPKKRSVLALLVANAGHPLSVDRIVEDVYGDDAEPATHRSIQTFISAFRSELGIAIERRGAGYVLEAEPESIDAVRFEQAVARAEATIAIDPESAARDLRDALALWRGHPYADVAGRSAFQPEVTRLSELRLTALELRIEADLAAGRHGLLLGELEALADQYPLRERFRALHMTALYRSGRQAEALRAYRRTERYLTDELGVDPSKELRDLELKILQQDDGLLLDSGRTVTQRLAFLVTDIEGSAGHWDRHPAAMAEALSAHDRLLTGAVEDAGGKVFKHTGDGMLAAFPDTASAVRAAEDAQRSLRDHQWGPLGELRVRMGIDAGDAESRAGDFFGPPLNRAARLMAAGHGGQVLVSASAQADLIEVSLPGIQLRTLGEFRLRGLAGPERIAQVIFVGLPAEFPDLRLDAEAELQERGLVPALPGYEIRGRIGEGAFGIVYRAYQPAVGREVAVKVIRPEFASRPSFVRGFEAEARTVARLAHPRIVPLHDFWRDANGAYLVMQLLPGGNLGDALVSGAMEPPTAVRCIHHVAEALTHAHDQGLVHGDVKPSNVLLDGSGNAYLSDFGIAARLFDSAGMDSPPSSAPAYRPPEEIASGPTMSGDAFALGVLAFEVLSGTPAEPGTAIPPISRVAAGIPTRLDPVVARATATDPGDRYGSVADFIAAFDAASSDLVEAVPAPPAVSRNPYKGLRAFDESDAADFRGRDDLVVSLLAAVERLRFVTVVGPSGSGKSSAVRAGLLPALRKGGIVGSDRWYTAVFTPGAYPHDSLVEALESLATTRLDLSGLIEEGDLLTAADEVMAEPDTDLLVVIDQFEELFTAVDSEERRSSFLQMVTAAATAPGSQVRFVATLRADFYDRPLAYADLDRLVRDGLVTVLRPTDDELAEMITLPALGVGLRWEPGLPHRIASDVHHQPGALPLLQFALTELVERRTGDLLTGTDYDRIGGATGALSLRAENFYNDLSPDQRNALRQILLRLVTVGEDGSDTRRRVRRSELETIGLEHALVDEVLSALTTLRLVTADRDPVTRGPTIEVAHEALLTAWQRFGQWIDHEREALLVQRRLTQAAAEWDERQRAGSFLATGGRLAQFETWRSDSGLAIARPEQEFLDASRQEADRARSRRRRVRNTITGAFAAAALVAGSLAVFAFVNQQRAEDAATEAQRQEDTALEQATRAEEQSALATQQRDEADRQRLLAEENAQEALTQTQIARVRELVGASSLNIGIDPERSVLLALEAIGLASGDELDASITALRTALAADRVVLRIPGDEFVDYGPDGTTIITGSAGDAAVWDASTGELIHNLPSPDGRLATRAAFSPEGSVVAVGYTKDGSDAPPGPLAILWDTATGAVAAALDGPELPSPNLMAFSGDGSLLAGSGNAPGVVVWDARTGTELYRVENGSGPSFSPDGSLLAYSDDTATDAGRVLVLDAPTGRELFALEAPGFWLVGTRFSPDGRRLAALSQNPGGVVIWDVESRREVASLPQDGAPTVLEWSPDGRTIALSGNEGIPRMLDPESGDEMLALVGQTSGVWSLSFDPSGQHLAAAAFGGETMVWDTTGPGPGEVAAFPSPYADAGSPVFTSVGAVVLFKYGMPSSIARLDPTTGEVLATIPDQLFLGPRARPRLLPGAGLVGALNADGSAALRELDTFDHVVDLPPGTVALAVSPDREWIVLNPLDEGAALLTRIGEWEDSVRIHEDGLIYANFDPTGELLSIYDGGTGDGWLVEVPTGSILASFPSPDIARDMSPDGSLLAVPTFNGRLRLLDTAALRSGQTPENATVWGPIDAHDGAIPDTTFNHDGTLVATSGLVDLLIRIWDTQTGALVADLGSTGVPFPAPFFHPNGTHVVAKGAGGTIRIFTLDTAELEEIARNRLTRNFTAAECDEFRIDPCPAGE